MGYLEQFARNGRRKEKSEVLTARLPVSLYSEFKAYCDELGLSISEAVCLLVEREMAGKENKTTTDKYINDYSNEINEHINSDDVVAATTETNTNTLTNTNTIPVAKKRNASGANTNRFTTKHWQIDGKIPCPICDSWIVSTNFARHAKHHNATTIEIFTSEEHKEKILAMIAEKQAD